MHVDESLALRNHFEDLLEDDEQMGCLAPVGSYVARFPEHEAVLRAAYERICSPSVGESPFQDLDVVEELGTGGQARVLLAHDRKVNRLVAVKELLPGNLRTPSTLVRFSREAKVLSQFEHPHICRLLDTHLGADPPYIVMQYVPGETLRKTIDRLSSPSRASSPLPDPEWSISSRVGFLVAVARAAHAMHEQGVVHRDLNPRNLIVTPTGSPMILDFGIAYVPEENLTVSGHVLGTYNYMSPEQIDGVAVDHRSDVWSLGVVAYEFLTELLPFRSGMKRAIRESIHNERPLDPRVLNEELTRDVGTVVLAALEKEPGRRYQSMAAFADDLEAASQGRPITAKPPGPAGRLLRWSRREPRLAASLAATILFALAAASFGTYLAITWSDAAYGRDQRYLRNQRDRLETAFLAVAEGSAPQALPVFKDVLAAGPDEVRALALVGEILSLLEARDWDLAEQRLRESEPRGPRELAWIKVRLLSYRRREAEAETLRRKLGEPDTSLGHFILGSLALWDAHGGTCRLWPRDHDPAKIVEFRAARAHFEQAAFLGEGRQALPLFMLSHAARHCGHSDLSRSAIRALTRRWPTSARAWFEASGALHGQDAIDACQNALRLDQNLDQARLFLVFLFMEARRFADAEREARECLRCGLASRSVRQALAQCVDRLGRHGEADAMWDELLADFPDDAKVVAARGFNCLQRGDANGAIQLFERATGLDPAFGGAWGGLAQARHSLGHHEPAADAIMKAVEIYGRHGSAAAEAVRMLYLAGRYSEALSLSADALSAGSPATDSPEQVAVTTASLHYHAGRIHDQSGRTAAARSSYEAAATADPRHPEAHFRWARLLVRLKELAGAETVARRGLAALRDDPDLQEVLARILMEQGRDEEADEILDRLLARTPDRIEGNYLKGNLRFDAADWASAIPFYARSAEAAPAFAEAWSNLGTCYVKLHRFRDAVGAFDKVQVMTEGKEVTGPLGRVGERLAALRPAAALEDELIRSIEGEKQLRPPSRRVKLWAMAASRLQVDHAFRTESVATWLIAETRSLIGVVADASARRRRRLVKILEDASRLLEDLRETGGPWAGLWEPLGELLDS